MLTITSVDVAFNETYSQYRDPSSDKSKKKRSKSKVHQKKLFGRNKTKKLKKNQDPFATKQPKKKKKSKKDPFASKGKGKGKIKEKDAFTSKPKKKKYHQKYKKKSKGKRKSSKGSGKKQRKVFILKNSRKRNIKEKDSFLSKPNKSKPKSPSEQPNLFHKGVNPAKG